MPDVLESVRLLLFLVTTAIIVGCAFGFGFSVAVAAVWRYLGRPYLSNVRITLGEGVTLNVVATPPAPTEAQTDAD